MHGPETPPYGFFVDARYGIKVTGVGERLGAVISGETQLAGGRGDPKTKTVHNTVDHWKSNIAT